MSKIFTCCELIKRIREYQEAPTNNWPKKDKYLVNEFLRKMALTITNKRVKEWINSEPVWTADYDYFFCEECKKWFDQQKDKQVKLIDAQIKKEKAEGTFYTNPDTQEALKKFKRQADEVSKELEKNEPNDKSPPFGKSPQE